jgi:hypothetical protein
MPGRTFALILLLMFLTSGLSAQWVAEQRVPLIAQGFDVDMLGRIYSYSGASLTQTSPDLQQTCRFSLKSKGEITSVDASDPFKILVYYGDFSSIQFLDNTLTPSGMPVNLEDLGLSNVRAVCASTIGSFWVFDASAARAVRYDQRLQPEVTTVSLTTLTSSPVNVVQLREAGDYLFLYNQNDRILVFDRFGALYRSIPVNELLSFSYESPFLYLFKEKTLERINFLSLESTTTEIPTESYRKGIAIRQLIYLLCDGEVLILKQP